MRWLALPGLLALYSAQRGPSVCSDGSSPSCGGINPVCPDGSPFNSATFPPCPGGRGNKPVCQDGNRPSCADGNRPSRPGGGGGRGPCSDGSRPSCGGVDPLCADGSPPRGPPGGRGPGGRGGGGGRRG